MKIIGRRTLPLVLATGLVATSWAAVPDKASIAMPEIGYLIARQLTDNEEAQAASTAIGSAVGAIMLTTARTGAVVGATVGGIAGAVIGAAVGAL